jgi:Domain of unknown function (DUF4412)
MKRRSILLLTLLLLVPLGAIPLGAQTPFEGTVTMSVTGSNSGTQSITYMLKAGKMRFEPSMGGRAGQAAVIIDPTAQTMMVIMPAQKMYMESNFGATAAAMQAQAGGAKHQSVARTGRMDTIAGYKCEHVTVTDDDGTTVDSCISNELGGFRMPSASNPMAPQKEAGWVTALGSGAFPLKVEKGGKTLMEVTSIEKKSLDAALFTAPDGYRSFQMPTMPKRPLER